MSEWERKHVRRIDIINCIAVMVVGALIFVLGIDLVKEALWDTRHRVSRYSLSCLIYYFPYLTFSVLFFLSFSFFVFAGDAEWNMSQLSA